MIHLVLGGARSGKSRYGEALVRQYTALGFDACYVATAQALDDEMATRIAKHQAGRTDDGIEWQLFEESLALTALLKRLAKPGRVILVDCLTLWLTNQLLASSAKIDDERRRLSGMRQTLYRLPVQPLTMKLWRVGRQRKPLLWIHLPSSKVWWC